jgi:hypothetical protein
MKLFNSEVRTNEAFGFTVHEVIILNETVKAVTTCGFAKLENNGQLYIDIWYPQIDRFLMNTVQFEKLVNTNKVSVELYTESKTLVYLWEKTRGEYKKGKLSAHSR